MNLNMEEVAEVAVLGRAMTGYVHDERRQWRRRQRQRQKGDCVWLEAGAIKS